MTRYLIISFLLVGCSAPAATAQEEAPVTSSEGLPRIVSVSGEGTQRAAPDQATVRFGIATRSDDPEEARVANADRARDVMNAVRDLGVSNDKIQLATLRLQPVREYNREERRYEEKGFEAIRQLVVELDDLEVLPTLVAQVVQKGANRLDGITYGLADRGAVRDAALREAVLNARDKALLMAGALGVELGPVQQITEQSFSFPRPIVQLDRTMALAKTEDVAPEPEAYAAGEIEVQASVRVVFGLE